MGEKKTNDVCHGRLQRDEDEYVLLNLTVSFQKNPPMLSNPHEFPTVGKYQVKYITYRAFCKNRANREFRPKTLLASSRTLHLEPFPHKRSCDLDGEKKKRVIVYPLPWIHKKKKKVPTNCTIEFDSKGIHDDL